MADFLGHPITLPVVFESVSRRWFSDTVSLRRSIVDSGSQRWQVRFGVRPDGRGDLLALLQAHRYRQESDAFEFDCPQQRGGQTAGEIALVNAAPAGALSVVVRAVGAVVEVPAGTMFRLGGKVYMVTARADTHIGAAVPLRFHPRLAEAASSADAIRFGATVRMRVRYPPDSTDTYTYDRQGVASATVTLEEAV